MTPSRGDIVQFMQGGFGVGLVTTASLPIPVIGLTQTPSSWLLGEVEPLANNAYKIASLSLAYNPWLKWTEAQHDNLFIVGPGDLSITLTAQPSSLIVTLQVTLSVPNPLIVIQGYDGAF